MIRELGHPVQQAWRDLARHFEGCERCAAANAGLRQVPEDPAATDLQVYQQLCPDGRELHGAWVAAKAEWLESTRDYRRRLGVLGASQDAVLLRDAAWAKLDDGERRRYLGLPDAERFRLLEALEAGILAQRRAGSRASSELNERRRAGGSESIELAERPAWLRPGDNRRPRAHLEGTE